MDNYELSFVLDEFSMWVYGHPKIIRLASNKSGRDLCSVKYVVSNAL